MVAVTLLAAACNPFPETWEWNQELTIEVQTPQGLARGSAVTHVSWQEANSVSNYPTTFSGEATVVEVLPGRYLFALMGEDTRYIAMRTFDKEIGGFSVSPSGFAAMSRARGVRSVPRKFYPLLVTFTDITDPKTVRKVDPDDLAASFGPGVTLKGISLGVTDKKVTEGRVDSVLAWLSWPREKLLAAGGGSNPVQLSIDDGYLALGRGEFRRTE
ncbi:MULTISPECIES: hypothetical protein [Hyphomicrobiales]|uniref:hypothetical protein n=1 Tax=Hyphomicrobiales TaxID=356 RepID=UPI0012FC61EE|nr:MULTISPECIES: hypothetical protein [Phyllobacteriaceae]MCX8572825.1 hypothetical protein [Aminobacter sp. MET-1]